MNTTAYELWNRIKHNPKGCVSIDGTRGMRAAAELANACFIKIDYLTKYELRYHLYYYEEDKDSNKD